MITIDSVTQKFDKRRSEIRARILVDGKESSLFFQWRGVVCPNPANVFLTAMLGAAMAKGHNLKIDGRVSETVAGMLEQVQDRLPRFHPALKRVGIEGGRSKKSQTPHDKTGNLIGSIFWGDLDSYFTLARKLSITQALVFIPDLNGRADDHHNPLNRLQLIKHTASELKKELIRVDTNLGDLYQSEPPEMYRFFAELSIGWLLSGQLARLYVPVGGHDSGRVSADSIFEGLSGSGVIDFTHHGAGKDRNEKIEDIVSNPDVLDTILVCWENPSRAYNCGRCGSCRRIKSPLEVINGLS
ncbi:MAG: hypothetical protein JRD68_04225 [Deltaproteobacteria bacterium]|nr:hypothetical protein [Deltaproteobacteria bacterium]